MEIAQKRERRDKMDDIVANILIDRSSDQIIDCAVSMASISKARLDGIDCVYQSLNPALPFEASAAAVAIATEYDRGEKLIAVTLEKFQIAAKRAGISHGNRTICGRLYPAGQTLAEISRLYDLGMVVQPRHARPDPGDLIRSRSDISVDVRQFSVEAFNIHKAILSLAADKGTDLIVMGGYGRSKLREFILGGVTRGMLKSLTVPALISH